MQCGNNVPCIIYHITHHITSYNIELLVCLHNSTGGIETAAIAAPVCEGSVSMFARVLALNKAKKVRGNQIARGSSNGSLDGGSAGSDAYQLVAADSDAHPGLADVRSWFRSRGKSHGAIVAQGMARKKARCEEGFATVADDWRHRVVSMGFSSWSRGSRSAASSKASFSSKRQT